MLKRILLISISYLLILLVIWVEKSGNGQSEYNKKLSALKNANAADYFQLGKWAEEKQLFGPVKLYIAEALKIIPEFPGAKESLSLEMKGALPANYFEAVKDCRKKIYELEQKCANRWALLAAYCNDKKLEKEKQFCLDKALIYDPNCKSAHEALGDVKVNDFGWVSKDKAEKLNKGLTEVNGEWITRKEAEKLRSNWDNAWELRSDHYMLRTDIPFDKAISVLNDLEYFYDAFLDIFYGIDGFSIQPNQVFPVYYFKDNMEFQEHADQCDPAFKNFVGYYTKANDFAVHLWAFNDDPSVSGGSTEQEMLFHECTHQLFSQLQDLLEPNYWVCEGIACYSETFKSDKGKPFGNRTVRFDKAKAIINDQSYIPLREFVGLNVSEWTSYMSNNYNQSLSLTLFFMQNEKYELRFLEYVVNVFKTRGKLGQSFEGFMNIDDLDKTEKEWIEFVKKKM